MAGKGAGSGQVISLPSGGGALHGIGEKFSPDLQTGTGNFSVPITLPPGRNGFQPQLTLGYSTGAGNGPFGMGWGLSVPGVARKTSHGIPLYDDAADTFILSGAEDLVSVEETGTTTRYRPRTEGLFARITHHHDASNDYWSVASKDGLVSRYGTEGAAGHDPAVVADPENREHVFAWRLTQTVDPFGNRIEYGYDEHHGPQDDSPHHWDQTYLSTVHYADYGGTGDPRFLITVRFRYEPRPDPFSDYRAGFEIRTILRCTRIEVYTESDTPVRVYHLDYLDERGFALEELPVNGVSLLSRIRVEGRDGDVSEWLPPLEFGYTRFAPDRRDFFPVTGDDMPPSSLAGRDYELVDLTGDGLPDVLEMNGSVRYWRNRGEGKFDRPRFMDSAPAGVALADPGVQMIDANGDGRMDLLVTTPRLSGYYPLGSGPGWDARSFQRYDAAPSFNLEDPEVKLVDLDGDGVTDAIRSSTRLECFFNDPHRGWLPGNTRWVERKSLDEFPNVTFADTRVRWADMTGDGLQDIVLIHAGLVEYWPALGRGKWAKRIAMRNSPRLPWGYDPRRLLLGDVDGDGAADLVYVDDTQVTLWINRTGNEWSEPITIDGTPPVSDMDAVRLADVCGSGIAGVLWSKDAGTSHHTMFFLDFTGGTKPYLLDSMDNHIGAVTKVEYAPSTRFYLLDDARPETRWKTSLPFPVQVVSRMEVIDALSGGKLTTEYAYHHGYWDGAEREFRGFGRVDHRDTEVFADFNASGLHGDQAFKEVDTNYFSPPTETRTWFHLGPVGDEFGGWQEADFSGEYWQERWDNTSPPQPTVLSRPAEMAGFLAALPRRARRDALRALRGRILRTELYALDGTERQDRPYTVTEGLHGVCEVREEGGRPQLVSAPQPGDRADLRDDGTAQRVFFPHDLAARTSQWERGEDPMTQFTYTDNYDGYGQPGSQTAIAVPRGRDFRADSAGSESYLATYTVTTRAQRDDGERYIVDRVSGTTAYDISTSGPYSVFTLHQKAVNDALIPSPSVIGHTLHFYDCPAAADPDLRGLPWGQIGDYGALVRSESLVLTEDTLHEAYRSGDHVLSPPETPPYFASGSTWTSEYPAAFRDLLPPGAGYVYQPGGASPPYRPGYYAIAERRRYDFHEPARPARGLLIAAQDPLGHKTTIDYETYALLPNLVTDPAGLTVRAEYDYRVLQPTQVTDPNGNQKLFVFSPLGLLTETWVCGKPGQAVGDRDRPSVRFEYDFGPLDARGEPASARAGPISIHTLHRIHHDTEPGLTPAERDTTIETREYSDGFGRLLQTRVQAEDVIFGDPVFGTLDPAFSGAAMTGTSIAAGGPPRTRVSGWQVYDNKGRVVEKYEPFFDSGWEYVPPSTEQSGAKVTMYYDPRGRVVRTVNPDGSEQSVVYGVPCALTTPYKFSPTPWKTYTYDANDSATWAGPPSPRVPLSHLDTPSSSVIDALGRTVETVVRNGRGPADWYVTRSTYDVQGNLLTVTDELGRLAFQHVYDLAKRPLRTEQLDAGVHRTIVDAAGNQLERRDSKGALLLEAHDVLNRLTHSWARDLNGEAATLRLRSLYGDSPDTGLATGEASARNLLGKLYRQYDEAGTQTVETYDFKGNILEKVRQVVSDDQILAVFSSAALSDWKVPAYRVDWTARVGSVLSDRARELLDPVEYRTSLEYDALNRLVTVVYPQDVGDAGHAPGRKELRPTYNRAGALEHIELDGDVYVERIAYDAKGQRSLIAYGNGLMTRYAYDRETFRLAHLRTEKYGHPDALTYVPAGTVLQDFSYEYDLVGNLTGLHDRTPGCGVPSSPDRLDRSFTYDPIYRLLSATGRECDVLLPHPEPLDPWDGRPKDDNTRPRPYTESYQYDPAGNMVQLQHAAAGGSFTRLFALDPMAPPGPIPANNRLQSVTIGSTVYDYAYDPSGNMIGETSSRHFEWDHSDRLRVFRTQTDGAEPTVHAHYLYDASSQRVKKLVRKKTGFGGSQVEVTVYIDGFFEYHRLVTAGGSWQDNNMVHVMDNRQRIALLRVGAPFPDDRGPEIQYQLDDHVGSSNVVANGAGWLVNREEYRPFGETSFGSFAAKRYQCTGKERDEESGLYYFGARYHAPWLARWNSCDPLGATDGLNVYEYVHNNPIRFIDPRGLDAVQGGTCIVVGGESYDMSPEEIAAGMCNGAEPPQTTDKPEGDQPPGGKPPESVEPIRKAAATAVTPTNIKGELAEGPMHTWSGEGAGKPEALASIQREGGWMMGNINGLPTKQHARAETMYKPFQGEAHTPEGARRVRDIWGTPSADVAGGGAGAGMPWKPHPVDPKTGELVTRPGSIQTDFEIPAIKRSGPWGAGGGLAIVAGIHTALTSDCNPNSILGAGQAIAGVGEVTGGLIYAGGAFAGASEATVIGAAISEVGGGAGLMIVAGSDLVEDFNRGDSAMGFVDAIGTLGGGAVVGGALFRSPVFVWAGTMMGLFWLGAKTWRWAETWF